MLRLFPEPLRGSKKKEKRSKSAARGRATSNHFEDQPMGPTTRPDFGFPPSVSKGWEGAEREPSATQTNTSLSVMKSSTQVLDKFSLLEDTFEKRVQILLEEVEYERERRNKDAEALLKAREENSKLKAEMQVLKTKLNEEQELRKNAEKYLSEACLKIEEAKAADKKRISKEKEEQARKIATFKPKPTKKNRGSQTILTNNNLEDQKKSLSTTTNLKLANEELEIIKKSQQATIQELHTKNDLLAFEVKKVLSEYKNYKSRQIEIKANLVKICEV